uniref:RNA-dependent RNA polymerase 6 n=1 Tax=Tanacetum cinerariifolium TaxID=118510 RepID=A0A6L2JQW1_TANCI|nr:RNA-dependent RNA polymerase 6 [Tanacetum cinerariifolium]
MANLEYYAKHNMVTYLEKTDGNTEFHEMVDFLTRSFIHCALTISPDVCTSFIKQFWNFATSKTLNNGTGGLRKDKTMEHTPNDSPLSGRQSFRGDGGELTLQDLLVTCTKLSKQGRKKAKTRLNIEEGDFNKLDDLVDEGVDYDVNDGRSTDKIEVLNAEAEGVSAAGETLSAATLAVSTANVQESSISTAGIVSTAGPSNTYVACPSNQEDVQDLFDDETRITDILVNIANARPRPVLITDPEQEQRRATPIVQPTIDPKDKGKGKMVEPEPTKELKNKDFDVAQIARDEEVARQLEAQLKQIQAKMDASEELAARPQMKEREMYTVEERSRLLAEYFENKKKQLAAERSATIRNMPPTKTQLRSLMMTYLKNMDMFTHSQLNKRSFKYIQALYLKEQALIADFVPIGSEEDERRIRDMNMKAKGESNYKCGDSTKKRKAGSRMKRMSKRQKTDADLEEEDQLKIFLNIIPDEEGEVDYAVLDKSSQLTMFHNKELAILEQTATGKEISNPLMADSLPKTIWLSIHHVIAMKNWLFRGKRQPIKKHQIRLWLFKEDYEVPLKLVLELLEKEKIKSVIYTDYKSLQHIFDQKELNMHQKRWIKLFSDYDCEICYHPGKANVMANALSRKERVKPKRVQAMSITIQCSIMDKLLAAQYEASKEENALTKMLCGLDQQMEKKEEEAEIGESSLIGPELVQETTDKVVLIKENLKAARDHQKSYVDNRHKQLEYEVGDRVLLKVSPWKGVICFGTKGKLALRYVGPFEILERIGPVAYWLRLLEELSSVHDTFHVSNLKKYLANANLHVPLDEIKIDKTLRFVEEPVEIMDLESIKFRDEISLRKEDCDARDLNSCELLGYSLFGMSSVVDWDRMKSFGKSETTLLEMKAVDMGAIIKDFLDSWYHLDIRAQGNSKKPLRFSDGIGKMSPELAFEVTNKLQLTDVQPCANQIRYAGCKGVVVWWPDKKWDSVKLSLRPSMNKFESEYTLKMVTNLDQMLVDTDVAFDVITSSSAESGNTASIMLVAGFKPQIEPHLRGMLNSIQAAQLKDLYEKAWIFVHDGRQAAFCCKTRCILLGGLLRFASRLATFCFKTSCVLLKDSLRFALKLVAFCFKTHCVLLQSSLRFASKLHCVLSTFEDLICDLVEGISGKIFLRLVWGCDRLVSRAKVIENQVIAILVISVSLDSSEDNVGTLAGRVILFGTIPTTIPDTTPVITPPTTQTDITVILTKTTIIVPTIPPSPDYTPASPDYSPASKIESDPSEDPSLDHIPPLPAVLLLLSSDDDTTNSDTPDTPPSPTHGTPFTEITASTQRSPQLAVRHYVDHSSSGSFSPDNSARDSSPDSSLEASPDFHSDASSDSSSRHSLSDHSSLDLPSTSTGPSRKRRRSPVTSVPVLPLVSGALSHVRADLIPSPKRVKDSGYLVDVEVGPRETKIERVTHHAMPKNIPEPAQEGAVEVIEGVQREQGHRIVGVESAVTDLTERVAELERDNRRLRGTVSVESHRVDRLQRGMRMPNIRSKASMTHEEVEELVARRVAEETGALKSARNLETLNENGDEQEGENGGNGNGGIEKMRIMT